MTTKTPIVDVEIEAVGDDAKSVTRQVSDDDGLQRQIGLGSQRRQKNTLLADQSRANVDHPSGVMTTKTLIVDVEIEAVGDDAKSATSRVSRK